MAIKTRIPEIYDSITSAAWITPEGEFIPLNGNIHDDYWSRFGIPEGEKYPSRIAVKMGYAKVSNPFVVSVNRIMRSDPRLESCNPLEPTQLDTCPVSCNMCN
jgi:hypothetical protein